MMNTDTLFTFTTIQKDLPQPANDLAAKAKVQTRKASETDSASKAQNKTVRAKDNEDRTEQKSFDDYISDTKGDAAPKPAQGESAPAASTFSQLQDLRDLLASLLEDLKDGDPSNDQAALEAFSDATDERSPEDLLLSLIAGEQRASETGDDQNGLTENTRGLFLTQTALQTPKQDNGADAAPQGLLNLLNTPGARQGLQALAEFLSRDDLSAIDGLTPEILTQLQQDVETALEEDRNFDSFAALNDILTRIVKLIEPAKTGETVQAQAETAETPEIGHTKNERFEGRYDLDRFGQTGASLPEDAAYDFKSALRAAQAVHTPAEQGQLKTSVSTPALMLALGAEGGLFAQPEGGFIPPANAGSAAVITTPTLTGPSLTSPSLHASSAAQPHPAVQTVAATIQKVGAEKLDTRITLQLDPPELGRVEVKMSVNKDNAAKVVLTIEKPETFAMLQRDAHALERALADAGLSPDGSGLEFSLADEGYAFGREDGQGGGPGKRYSANGAEDEQSVIIASSMGWSVNPVTGRMQYDALV